ncbi:sensor histidine kinase [Gracilibacillus dipsosauri]|uniref:Two-component sensor histidine kinase n=1 Tax=Gracilibacillus dipsosauri TaxID=178340 RepID=A0A317KVD0_9BACI|nr:histidine kinase [Gracilibacillus dipsosauri]PWU67253.1 two-component sensor histidine kinase [Gracilibacillus dipsosauri]
MLKIPVNSLRKTIFARLLIMFFILILPIIVFGIYLYNWTYQNTSQEISKNTVVQLTSYLGNLNREIEWIEIQQFDILQETELRKIAYTWDMMDNIERKDSVNYIIHRLTSIKNTNIYIKDISIHLPSIDKTISVMNAAQDFNKLEYEKIRTSKSQTGLRLIQTEDTLSLSASIIGNDLQEHPQIVVHIELDKQKMSEDLNTLNMYPNSSTFLVSDDKELLLESGEKTSNAFNIYYHTMRSKENNDNVTFFEDKRFHINSAYSKDLKLSVVTFIPEDIVKLPLKKFSRWAWGFAITSLVVIILYSYLIYRMVHKPLVLLVDGFRRMEDGELNNPIEHEQEDEFGFLYNRYNIMLYKLRRLIEQDYKQKLMMQKAELKQLQSQINPHFLYNSFFILNSLAKTEDTERMEQFTSMLGEYFKFITRNEEEHVTLSEEMKHARMYTEIQQLRFSRRIKVQFDELPEEMEHIKVPKLIVQPIIENAFEHSLEKKVDEGLLWVHFKKEHHTIYIVVEDNGDGISTSKIEDMRSLLNEARDYQEQTGMTNIHRRILLTYGANSGLYLSRSETNGLKVEIRINLEEDDSNV